MALGKERGKHRCIIRIGLRRKFCGRIIMYRLLNDSHLGSQFGSTKLYDIRQIIYLSVIISSYLIWEWYLSHDVNFLKTAFFNSWFVEDALFIYDLHLWCLKEYFIKESRQPLHQRHETELQFFLKFSDNWFFLNIQYYSFLSVV